MNPLRTNRNTQSDLRDSGLLEDMDHPSRPSTPPPRYTDIFNTCSTPLSIMDQLFDLHRGAAWTLDTFCNTLLRTHRRSLNFGVISIQHRKRLWEGFQHEFLILDVVPLISGTSTPQQAGIAHTYIEIGRFRDSAGPSHFCACVTAEDRVMVLEQGAEASVAEGFRSGGPGRSQPQGSQSTRYSAGECLATLSWTTTIPDLLDVLFIISSLSVAFPNYNILTRQCFWLARATYEALKYAYQPVFENTGNRVFKRAKFFVFIRLFTPTPPSALLRLFRHQSQWSSLAKMSTGPSADVAATSDQAMDVDE